MEKHGNAGTTQRLDGGEPEAVDVPHVSDKCALCAEKFSTTMSKLQARVPFRKKAVQRKKHSCRVCARLVCEAVGDGAEELPQCCSMSRVPKRLWHRSLASLRKPESSATCPICLPGIVPNLPSRPLHLMCRTAEIRPSPLDDGSHAQRDGDAEVPGERPAEGAEGVRSGGRISPADDRAQAALEAGEMQGQQEARLPPMGSDSACPSSTASAERHQSTAGPEDCPRAPAISDPPACSCCVSWLCRECEQMWNTLRFGRTSARLEELTSGAGFTGGVAERQERLEAAGAAELAWAAGLDCDESDDARRLLGLAARLERLCAFFEQGREPAWPRPPAKPRALAHQLGQTALRTAEETLNIFAGGKIKAGYKALKLAKGGFRVAELFAEYVLSEEFLQAWAMLLEQLSEFVEDDEPVQPGEGGSNVAAASADAAQAGAERSSSPNGHTEAERGEDQGSTADSALSEGGVGERGRAERGRGLSAALSAAETVQQTAASHGRKARTALDLCYRFYYYSLRLMANAQQHRATPAPGVPNARLCGAAELDAACEHLFAVSLLYRSSLGAQPSTNPTAEAAWFLASLAAPRGLVLLDEALQSGTDARERSLTHGAKRPAFALLAHAARRELLLVVRGTQEKHDHLIDIDFATDRLLPPALPPHPAPAQRDAWDGLVHRGMVRAARFLLYEHGARAALLSAPRDFAVRVVGHSLGAGTAALVVALLLADPLFQGRDVSGVGFGMPACVEPALAMRLQGRVTSVIHREDAVPRLSFTNLMKLREQFNREEEKEWCRLQIERDAECLWQYVGWPMSEMDKEKKKLLQQMQPPAAKAAPAGARPPEGAQFPPAVAALEALKTPGTVAPGASAGARNIAGDLVRPRSPRAPADARRGAVRAVRLTT